MTTDFANFQLLAAHEGAHAVCGRALGFPGCAVYLNADGGVTRFCVDPPSDETEARAAAIVLWAGKMGEAMLLPKAVWLAAGESSNDGDSDIVKILQLANKFAGYQPAAWVNAAKRRARAILGLHFGTLVDVQRRLWLATSAPRRGSARRKAGGN
jgi:hypothetical protein